ncbi:large subunit ribosomal protein L9 [Mycoplasma testudineum]|uniref:Large ribosomal subunit protein bL9 n=1 Tax=Mycoplasma testudineum TaxID=244584 RepID=A0A4R6IFL0_9MOLU|nr:50S ribosomal protein L9 [Mycoplasma testudineum]OYD27114.1 50S ribosomal protein L9 [Mycoplasma testudineum]TDO21133.1 large subunit ribosomal protein L9 [Mycoplasma testudineum]
MKVIIIKDNKDGKVNDVIDVSPGYASNFLIKNGLGVPYNKENVKLLNKRLEAIAKEHEIKRQHAIELKSQLEKVNLTYKLKVNHTTGDGQTHHSITTKQIMASLADSGFHLEKHSIEKIHLNYIGNHKIVGKLYDGIEFHIQVRIEEDV